MCPVNCNATFQSSVSFYFFRFLRRLFRGAVWESGLGIGLKVETQRVCFLVQVELSVYLF